MAIEIKNLLKQMLETGASDLYIKVGSPPFLRVNGDLISTNLEKITPASADTLIKEVVAPQELKKFDSVKELDSVYSVSGLGRFRYNLFIQRGTHAMVFRSIRTDLPSFEHLNLPVDTMKKLASEQRGLVLVTGHAGSGKSTTLAAMTDYINTNFQKHIITIEDPIEFVHSDK
ncbi:MAG: ATPase, T2SS/T4P/T4SS family, partial [Candidatus Omnitrophota bacterium]